MPLNCIPVTTSAQSFHTKLEAVSKNLFVDVGFWGGVTPDSLQNLEPLLQAGVLGVKSFLIDSGIDEFQPMATKDLEVAMPLLKKHGLPYLFHAEIDTGSVEVTPQNTYDQFLNSRPREWENRAIRLIIDLVRKNGCRSHIVHLSSSDAVLLIKEAKQSGLPVSAESCPHYLLLSREGIAQKKEEKGLTVFKCCPPIREESNREKLWAGLTSGVIDCVVSDHSPCTPSLKHLAQNDFKNGWGGIASLQFSLSLVWTEARRRGIELSTVSRWLSERPASLAGLSGKKGKIREGLDADYVVFDPDAEFEINEQETHHRHKITPYAKWKVRGKILKTVLRGETVFDKGQFSKQTMGRPLLKGML